MVSKLGYNYFKRSLYKAYNFTNILNLRDPQLNKEANTYTLFQMSKLQSSQIIFISILIKYILQASALLCCHRYQWKVIHLAPKLKTYTENWIKG